ncbi:pentatricopeptide repeat-containing protein MRL1, chloroplastic-like isoform X3 [Zingiber officinale]|uniref:pentatricopeptide repeat-containing protein MRL1, chloroplastic-like isoform X3 n=1 Tax=Zingiber officinale TaxID=94328 RepID=UPI001C4AF725|nr:pentatricopeptide repeat-containing protein MRL1, chloroplastic-like isoform X3 [Zingiber officinale]
MGNENIFVVHTIHRISFSWRIRFLIYPLRPHSHSTRLDPPHLSLSLSHARPALPIRSPSPLGMEVAFSAKPHTPIFYVPLPFPHSISNRLEFLRRGSHSRPSSGLRPLKRSKKSELKIHPSRCLYDDFSYEESVIAVAAVAAAFTASQLMHTKKRSESLHFSGLKVCDTFFFKPCKDDAAIRRKADASREFIISRHNQFVYEGKNKTFEMPQELHLEKGMHSTISDRKQHNAVKKGIGPCHTVSTSCNNSSPSGVNCQETSVCGKEEELDLRSISRFRSLIAEPLQFILLPNNSLHGQSSYDLKVQNVLAKSYYFTDNTKIQSPRARFKDASEREEKVLNKMNGHTQDMTKKLRRERNDSLLSRFPQLNGNLEKSTNGFSQWLRTYNHLLRAGRLKECIDLLENTERMGLLDMNKVHHMSFLNACKSQKAVKEAFQFCKLIQNPMMSTFNTLLSVCANSQDYEGAVQVMLLIKEAALKPDCKLYTTLISTCAKSGKVDAMFEVFHEMVNSGIEPNVNTYGALIDGCARAGQVAKAFGAYGIMRSKKVQPDRVVFNALITACGESGAVDRAFDVLSEMRAEPKPIDPDHVTIGALIKACTKADQVDRTREVYKMLQEYNITGTPEVYTIAVRSCSQIGDLEFGLGIYDDMKRNGVRPDEMFLSTLIDVAGHAGKVDAAFKILQDAKADGIKVGTMSYSSLMGACCNAKNWNKALELYEEIKTLRLLPTVSLLNALITSLCDADQLLKCVEVLDKIKKMGVQPNEITYSVLIVACERNGEAELAFTLFGEAKRDYILPNLIMCCCLTGLCLYSFKKAYSLGEPIVNFNSGRPQIDSKWTSLAIMVYRETIQAGVIPTIEVFSQVLGCLQFPRDCSLRNKFIENLGSHFDASKFANVSTLLDGFGEYDIRSFSILEEATSLGLIPRVSMKDNPLIVDARKLQIHTVEVYLLMILKGLKHRLAAGARLPNITILLPTEKTQIEILKEERSIRLAGRVGQAVGSLLRRLGLPYQGDESYGKLRINGLALRRWFQPKVTSSSFPGKPADMISTTARLAKGIAKQQRDIRISQNLSLE